MVGSQGNRLNVWETCGPLDESVDEPREWRIRRCRDTEGEWIARRRQLKLRLHDARHIEARIDMVDVPKAAGQESGCSQQDHCHRDLGGGEHRPHVTVSPADDT